MLDHKKFAEDNDISAELAKKIIDILDDKWLDPAALSSVLWRMEDAIKKEIVKEKIEEMTEKELNKIINDAIKEVEKCFCETIVKVNLAEWEDVLDKEFELLTTAKQTDSRYWDFKFSKKDLQEMATNFNEDVVGTEIPVDLNHDPEHIAYAWIEPWSMRVAESTKIEWQFSLFGKLYKFTPEWEDMVKTGKVRYFSLQIQHKFEQFVDKTKKVFNNVIRALALTNMPVIKNMAPILNEPGNSNLDPNHNDKMDDKKLQDMQDTHNRELADAKTKNDTVLAEKDKENKELSEKLEKIETEKHETYLSENLGKLTLSDENKIGFKGGEMDKVKEFVKTLSADQAKAYFEVHTELLTAAILGEEGSAEDGSEEGKEKEGEESSNKATEMAQELAEKKGIGFSDALAEILEKNPKLAEKVM